MYGKWGGKKVIKLVMQKVIKKVMKQVMKKDMKKGTPKGTLKGTLKGTKRGTLKGTKRGTWLHTRPHGWQPSKKRDTLKCCCKIKANATTIRFKKWKKELKRGNWKRVGNVWPS